MLLGFSGKVTYALPIAPPGGRGGPAFADGAYDQEECYEANIDVFGPGKAPLIPPAGSLPPDVREVISWNVRPGSGSWSATAYVRRCGRQRQCLEALFDREANIWYCSKTGAPCGPGAEPCAPVPEGEYYTWTEDYVHGRRKVRATAEGDPIFDPATAPEQTGSVFSGSSSTLLLAGGALALALLFFRR